MNHVTVRHHEGTYPTQKIHLIRVIPGFMEDQELLRITWFWLSVKRGHRVITLDAFNSLPSPRPLWGTSPYDFGGVLTNSNRDVINGDGIHKRNQLYKEMHCLHPGDLYPFTRKPLFVIVDSSNSVAYKVRLFRVTSPLDHTVYGMA
ncbi:hypothetical protein Chor_002057 [Crotalus horridus]